MSVEASLAAWRRRVAVQSMAVHVSVEVHMVISLRGGGCCCVLVALGVEMQGTTRLPVSQGVIAGQWLVMQGVESAGSKGLHPRWAG